MGLVRSPAEGPGGRLQWIAVAVPLLLAGYVVIRHLRGGLPTGGGGVALLAAAALVGVIGPVTDDRRLKVVSVVAALGLIVLHGVIV